MGKRSTRRNVIAAEVTLEGAPANPIAAAIARAGLTVAEAARRAGISEGTVRQWTRSDSERGSLGLNSSAISLAQIRRPARILATSMK